MANPGFEPTPGDSRSCTVTTLSSFHFVVVDAAYEFVGINFVQCPNFYRFQFFRRCCPFLGSC